MMVCVHWLVLVATLCIGGLFGISIGASAAASSELRKQIAYLQSVNEKSWTWRKEVK